MNRTNILPYILKELKNKDNFLYHTDWDSELWATTSPFACPSSDVGGGDGFTSIGFVFFVVLEVSTLELSDVICSWTLTSLDEVTTGCRKEKNWNDY